MKWEYIKERIAGEGPERLNELGAQGWELVSAQSGVAWSGLSYTDAVLKRPITAPPKPPTNAKRRLTTLK